MRGTGRNVGGFKASLGARPKLDPAAHSWYWNPNRAGARPAPAWFQAKLREVDPEKEIDVRWHPLLERWCVFYKKPNIQRPICQGWMLMMIVQYPDGSYMPLDERTLAAIFNASARKWGSGRAYFDQVESAVRREQAAKERRQRQDAIDIAMPSFEHSQIKVSGFGKSSGSKFSTYHS